MTKKKTPDREYSFMPSFELLRELRNVPPAEKMRWLDETNVFLSKFLKPEDIIKWKKLLSPPDKTA